MKAIDEDHFQFVHHNVSEGMMKVGMLQFVKYGVTIVKNRMCLTHQNVLEHTTMFHKHKMKKTMNSSLTGVLHQMIQIGQFIWQLVGWFCFIMLEWTINNWSLYGNAWLHHIWWIFMT